MYATYHVCPYVLRKRILPCVIGDGEDKEAPTSISSRSSHNNTSLDDGSLVDCEGKLFMNGLNSLDRIHAFSYQDLMFF